MNSFTTLNIITEDLLNIIRGSEVVRTEPISKMQLESWVHQYRSLLIKRDLDKKRLINPDYIQSIYSLEMEVDGDEYRTVLTMPNTIFRNYEDGFTWIGSTDSKEYQYLTEQRSQWQQYRTYTSLDPYVYLKDNRLYSNMEGPLDVKGLFENPMDVLRLDGTLANTDSPYPIPSHLIPTLKEMILKGELGIEADSQNDETNDSTHNID